jgi:hypothetical protein
MMQGKYSKKWRVNNPLKARYSQMKVQCKLHGVELGLEYEDLCAFFKEQATCYYCGGANTTYGLDRIDNDKGFSLDNCIPSCKVCNNLKRNSTLSAFLERAERLKDSKPKYLPIANRFKDKTLEQVREEIQQIQQRAYFLRQGDIITTLLSDKEDSNKMSNKANKPRTYPDVSKMEEAEYEALLEKLDAKDMDELTEEEIEILTDCERASCPAYKRVMERLQEEEEDDSSKTPSN